MAKLTLNNLAGGYGAVDALNANFDAIEAAFDNTVSRNGAAPNAMAANLDMNSKDIVNAAAINTQTLYINGVVVVPTGTVVAPYPDPAGQSGKYLKSNGTTASWIAVDDSDVSYTQTGTGATARTAQDKLREVFSVKDFGALGDGTTDDAAAIQVAIDAAEAAGAALLFPRGTYIVGTMLVCDTGNVRIVGEGKFQTILKRKSGSTIASVLHTGFTSGTSQINNVEVSDITFDGNTTTGGGSCTDAVVKVRNCGNSVFRRLKMQNGATGGFRTDTSTTTSTTNQAFNEYDDLFAVSNTGVGLKFQGEKDTRFGKLFTYGNTGDGAEFKAFKNDASTICETTECVLESILTATNGGNGVVFDQAEKYNIGCIQSNNNGTGGSGGWGLRLKSTQSSAGSGTNSLNIASLTSRNDQSGGIAALEADNALVAGLQVASCTIIGFGVALNSKGIHLQGSYDCQFGTVRITGIRGDGVKIENGTPLGVAGDAGRIHFASLNLSFNGDASATTNHGITIIDSSSKIHIGCLTCYDSQTSGTNYEVNIGASAGPVFIGTADLTAIAGGNEININTTGQVFIGPSEIRGARMLPLRDGVTAPTNNIPGFAQQYIDAADGDLKIRYADGVVKTIVVDT